MTSNFYHIIHYRYEHHPESSELVTIDELARLSKQHLDMIKLMVDWGLIEPPITDPQPLFFESTVPTIWKIMRIRKDLGVNWSGIGVILTLLERVESLEKEVERLEQNSNIIK
jgi:MerR family transcriptional regulator/heat shock protein HspR